jgi:hypothetical protein
MKPFTYLCVGYKKGNKDNGSGTLGGQFKKVKICSIGLKPKCVF